MPENVIAKIIRIIGIVTIVVGTLAFVSVGIQEENSAILIGGIAGSIISGVSFLGFSEIIELLDQNVYNQKKIIKKLDENKKIKKISEDIT